MVTSPDLKIPIGTRALIMSKLYYSVLSKSLENLDLERYYSVLYFIAGNDCCNQQHICNNLAIDKTAMVKVMDTLTYAGYILKKVNPHDRREHFISLTPKGKRQTKKIIDAFNAIDAKIFATVTKKDQEIFGRVLDQLSSSLKMLPSTDLFFNYTKTGIKTKKLTYSKHKTK